MQSKQDLRGIGQLSEKKFLHKNLSNLTMEKVIPNDYDSRKKNEMSGGETQEI